MAKLSEVDIAEIRQKYLSGQTSEHIASLYGVSGQYVRRLIKEGGWKELRIKAVEEDKKKLNAAAKRTGLSPARDAALLQAKSSDHFKKDTSITREYIVDQLRRGVSLTAAAKSAGITHNTLRDWRQKDPDFDLRCHEAQADFVGGLENLAGQVSTPKEALALLARHPLTKSEWSPQQEDKHTIKIEHSFTREDTNVIDAEFKEVKQITDG